MGYLIVHNPESGSAARDLIERARERLHDTDVLALGPGTDLAAAVAGAVDRDHAVVAAGGDGTVNAVAQHLVGRGTMGILPAGTLNHFARDLGLKDEDAALEVLEKGAVREVDLGRAGDRYFINHVGMGLYPEMVRERQEIDEGPWRWPATMKASLRSLRRARPLVGEIDADGDARSMAAWILFVGNNRYEATPAGMRGRLRLDEGVLHVWLVLAGRRALSRIRVARKLLTHREWRAGQTVHRDALRIEVRLRDRPRLISRDGELEGPSTTLEAEIVPRALRVLAPPDGR